MNKDFKAPDLSRVHSSIDLARFASGLNRVIVDHPSEARAFIMAEVGCRSFWILNPELEEFTITATPTRSEDTI